MMAPVISLFAIVGVAMVPWMILDACCYHVAHHFQLCSPYGEVGGYVLGIFVPPGEGAVATS